MKLLGIALALGVQPIVHLTRAQVTGGGGRPPAVRASISRFAEDDVSNVGIVAVHAIAPGDEQIADMQAKAIGAELKQQNEGIVVLGERVEPLREETK